MKRHKGFSLVELVVAIGVIIILLALTLPLMFKLQENGRVTQCTSNLQKIGAGLAAYIPLNDGRFPNLRPWDLPGSETQGPASIVSWAGKTGYNAQFAEMKIGRRPLNPFLGYKPGDKEIPMCSCPGDDFRNSSLGASMSLLSCYRLAGTSYYQNQSASSSAQHLTASSGGTNHAGISLSRVKSPSRMVAMAEASAFYPGWAQDGYMAQPDSTFLSLWHRDGKFTMLFADGRVGRYQVLASHSGSTSEWTFYNNE